MDEGYQALTERERETLRCLFAGHDAKSIAREFDLSVHTINERLRGARRKLGVSSSREAARLLAERESLSPYSSPYSSVDREIGLAAGDRGGQLDGQTNRDVGTGHRLLWLGGGMLIMSLLIAAAIFSAAIEGNVMSGQEQPAKEPVAAAAAAADAESLDAALAWISLVDSGKWEESWQEAGAIFRSAATTRQWAGMVAPVREPLGTVVSRDFLRATKTDTLPNAPKGRYEILEFRTSFSDMADTVETAIMVKEDDGWKVVGFFVRPGPI